MRLSQNRNQNFFSVWLSVGKGPNLQNWNLEAALQTHHWMSPITSVGFVLSVRSVLTGFMYELRGQLWAVSAAFRIGSPLRDGGWDMGDVNIFEPSRSSNEVSALFFRRFFSREFFRNENQ